MHGAFRGRTASVRHAGATARLDQDTPAEDAVAAYRRLPLPLPLARGVARRPGRSYVAWLRSAVYPGSGNTRCATCAGGTCPARRSAAAPPGPPAGPPRAALRRLMRLALHWVCSAPSTYNDHLFDAWPRIRRTDLLVHYVAPSRPSHPLAGASAGRPPVPGFRHGVGRRPRDSRNCGARRQPSRGRRLEHVRPGGAARGAGRARPALSVLDRHAEGVTPARTLETYAANGRGAVRVRQRRRRHGRRPPGRRRPAGHGLPRRQAGQPSVLRRRGGARADGPQRRYGLPPPGVRRPARRTQGVRHVVAGAVPVEAGGPDLRVHVRHRRRRTRRTEPAQPHRSSRPHHHEVRFRGWIEADEMREPRAMVRISSSTRRWRRPVGVAVLEAMAAGAVVLGTNAAGAVRDRIRHGRNGLIPSGGRCRGARGADSLAVGQS